MFEASAEQAEEAAHEAKVALEQAKAAYEQAGFSQSPPCLKDSVDHVISQCRVCCHTTSCNLCNQRLSRRPDLEVLHSFLFSRQHLAHCARLTELENLQG